MTSSTERMLRVMDASISKRDEGCGPTSPETPQDANATEVEKELVAQDEQSKPQPSMVDILTYCLNPDKKPEYKLLK